MANHPNRSKAPSEYSNPAPEDIIDLRARHGLTQTEAAERWMSSLGAVQKWEAPIGTPNNRRVHPLMWWAMQEILKRKQGAKRGADKTGIGTSAIEDEILDLIANRDDYTQSDLQGIVSVIVSKAVTLTK